MKPKRRTEPPPAASPLGRVLMWAVVITALAALVLLMFLARDILAQLDELGGKGGAASTRLLTGLFVVMCFAGFVAAALWAALKKVLGREGKKER
jgi:hypothetical protein